LTYIIECFNHVIGFLSKDLYTSFFSRLFSYRSSQENRREGDEEKRMMLIMIESKHSSLLTAPECVCVRVKQKKKKKVGKKAEARTHLYSKLTLHQSLLTMPGPT
jgi:hypothetical protein